MASTTKLPPRWIRLTNNGITEIQEHNKAELVSEQWLWLTTKVWDYRESCARHSCWQTWRSLLTKFFLWCAEKSCGSNQ